MSLATVETSAVESILRQVEQLSPAAQRQLAHLLTERQPAPDKAPPKQRLQPVPMPGDTRERQWISEHKHEYAGQWVALDGDRLVAASHSQQEVLDAARTDGAYLPLIARIPSHEETAQWEEIKRHQPTPLPPDQRPKPIPMPDDKRERQWIEEHKHEYAGHWVALDGDRLIAASQSQQAVLKSAREDGAYLPLILRVTSPDDLPFMGI